MSHYYHVSIPAFSISQENVQTNTLSSAKIAPESFSQPGTRARNSRSPFSFSFLTDNLPSALIGDLLRSFQASSFSLQLAYFLLNLCLQQRQPRTPTSHPPLSRKRTLNSFILEPTLAKNTASDHPCNPNPQPYIFPQQLF